MTRQEFLDELKSILTGQISPEAMLDVYRYYADYIDGEVRRGKTEEQVIEELGKPALLAKSIVAAQKGRREADMEYTEDGRTKKIRNGKGKSDNRNEKHSRQKASGKDVHTLHLTDLGIKVFTVLFFILLIIVVFFLLKISFWILITFGIPILLILGIVYLILYFIKD